jgi:hypothetical protein
MMALRLAASLSTYPSALLPPTQPPIPSCNTSLERLCQYRPSASRAATGHLVNQSTAARHGRDSNLSARHLVHLLLLDTIKPGISLGAILLTD